MEKQGNMNRSTNPSFRAVAVDPWLPWFAVHDGVRSFSRQCAINAQPSALPIPAADSPYAWQCRSRPRLLPDQTSRSPLPVHHSGQGRQIRTLSPQIARRIPKSERWQPAVSFPALHVGRAQRPSAQAAFHGGYAQATVVSNRSVHW